MSRSIDITGSDFAQAEYFSLYFLTPKGDISSSISPNDIDLNKITITLTYSPIFYTKAVDEVLLEERLANYKVDTVLQNNIDRQPKIASLCRTHSNTGGNYYTNKYFVFAHITDTHAINKTVKRAVDFLNDYQDIDMLLHTGDIQRKSFNDSRVVGSNNIDTFLEYLAAAKKPFLLSLGNHDQNGAGREVTLNDIYNRFMKPMVDKEWLTANTNIDASNYATWYYKDYSNYSIRFICLNSFDPLYDGFETNKGMDDNFTKYSPSQITWLINTLQSVPSGYHVIVALHTPYDNLSGDTPTIINPDWSSTIKVNAGTHNGGQPIMMNGNPMLDVIAAYKEKRSITNNYAYTDTTVQSRLGSISVDADFSSVNGEFAFMVIGHNHDDWVGEFQNKAGIKCICMAGSILTEPDSDLGRGYLGGSTEWLSPVSDIEGKMQGKSQDAINVYVVRTDLRKVFVVRFGADYTTDGRTRIITTIDY